MHFNKMFQFNKQCIWFENQFNDWKLIDYLDVLKPSQMLNKQYTLQLIKQKYDRNEEMKIKANQQREDCT